MNRKQVHSRPADSFVLPGWKRQKVNETHVEPIRDPHPKELHPVLGADLFPEPYANIFVCAKKKTGKTNVVAKILKECALPKKTYVLIFCSTLHKDRQWKLIRRDLKKRGVLHEAHTSMRGVLKGFVEGLAGGKEGEEGSEGEASDVSSSSDSEDSSEDESIFVHKGKGAGPPLLNLLPPAETNYRVSAAQGGVSGYRVVHGASRKRRRRKGPKVTAPKFIFVFDDLSNELRDPALDFLLKRNRHFKAKVIVSSQWKHDLWPSEIKQMDYALLFRAHAPEKLESLYRDLDIGSVNFPTFLQLYEDATAKPYSFLLVDTFHDSFRRNFNESYISTFSCPTHESASSSESHP